MLKPVIEKVFGCIPAFKFIDADKVVTGFFLLFVYKDFVLREVIDYFQKSAQQVSKD